MPFCQVWIVRKATRSNLAKPQTFSLEKQRGSNSGLRCSFIFWMSLYKDYRKKAQFHLCLCFLPLLEDLKDENTFHGLAKFSDQKP